MRETHFIEQNKKKWAEFEQILKVKEKDPDKLSELFVQITDDLSYSRTFYPNRSVRYYLNNIAQRVFYNIYKSKKSGFKNFIQFWKNDLPKIVYESRKELTLSLIIFLISAGIGIFSCANDPHFARTILGDHYVDMTIENIRSGDPMAVYKKMNQTEMFLGITFNNLLVAFRTFVMGIFLAIGTIAIMLYNGIMVGTFQYFFYERGLFLESSLTIWLHGTLEISSIILAGGAGLKLGSGLLFPGSYSRIQSFQLSARKSLGLMIGITPILIFAAIIESFVTRYTEVGNIYKILLIAVSLGFIVGYFIILPALKAKRGFPVTIQDEKLPADKEIIINYENISSNPEIFRNIFVLYKKHFRKIFTLVISTAIIYTASVTYLANIYFPENLSYKNWFYIKLLFTYHTLDGNYIYIFNLITLAVNIFFTGYLLKKESHPDEIASLKKYFTGNFYKALIISLIIQLILFLPYVLIILTSILVLPVLFLLHKIMYIENLSIAKGIHRTASLTGGNYFNLIGLFFMLTIVSVVYYFLIDSPVTYIFFEVLNWNLNLENKELRVLYILFMNFVSFLGLGLILPIYSFGFGLSYFSTREIKEAINLKERISNFGVRNKNVYR